MFGRKKKIIAELEKSFGKIKEQDFHFHLIDKYFRNKLHQKETHTTSDSTCSDLDFDEFFQFFDRTSSKIGQQYLYNQLRRQPKERPSFELQEKLISKLSTNTKLRLEVQFQLHRLNMGSGPYHIASLFQEEPLPTPKWIHLFELLAISSALLVILAPFFPVLALVLSGLFAINLCIHLWNKKHVHFYLESIPEVITMNEVARKLVSYQLPSEQLQTTSAAIKIISKIKRKMSFFQLDRATDGDFAAIGYAIFEFIKIMFLLEPVFLFSVLKKIKMIANELETVFEFVGSIDVSISILSVRQGLDQWCIPNFLSAEKSLSATEIYHPLLHNCVRNSIATDENSILLTGSNMSGKTTFIRTIGLNLLTATTVNTCFASSFETSMFSMHSAIRISDDLMNSKSYYLEEVATIKAMIDASLESSSNLFLLDEIFKGTNTVERISAGKAVLSALSKGSNLVFVSTHDVELTTLLNEEYACYHFSENVENNTLDFDYKIKNGELQTRNAIKILAMNGYPAQLVKEANELTKKLDPKT